MLPKPDKLIRYRQTATFLLQKIRNRGIVLFLCIIRVLFSRSRRWGKAERRGGAVFTWYPGEKTGLGKGNARKQKKFHGFTRVSTGFPLCRTRFHKFLISSPPALPTRWA